MSAAGPPSSAKANPGSMQTKPVIRMIFVIAPSLGRPPVGTLKDNPVGQQRRVSCFTRLEFAQVFETEIASGWRGAIRVSLIPAPQPPLGSFDPAAAARGDEQFSGKADCNSCHVERLWTDPGWNLHTPAEICIDSFQAAPSTWCLLPACAGTPGWVVG
jgi:hypothetical protein